jgi:Rha family phage regulatory protein
VVQTIKGVGVNEIVTLQHREATTTSLVVAEVFVKRHDDVLRAIRNLNISETFRLRNFAESSYTNEQGKQQPMFTMKRDGCIRLTMSFTGKKAAECVERYIDAFNKMETALLNQKNLSWQEERASGKVARRVETDCIALFVEYAVGQGSQNAPKYFMSITKMTNKALFMVSAAGPQSFRDTLDAMQLSCLTVAEYLVREVLEDGMRAGLHYKDIYSLARDRVTAYAATLPKLRLLSA